MFPFKKVSRRINIIILVPFFNFKNHTKSLNKCCFYIFSPEGNFDRRQGWGWGGEQITKNKEEQRDVLHFSTRKGTLTDAGDGDGELFKQRKEKYNKSILGNIFYTILLILYTNTL